MHLMTDFSGAQLGERWRGPIGPWPGPLRGATIQGCDPRLPGHAACAQRMRATASASVCPAYRSEAPTCGASMSSAGYLETLRHERSERCWSSRGLALVLAVVVAGAVAACTGGDSPAANGAPSIRSLSSTPTSSGQSKGRTIDEKFVVAADGRRLALACWGEGSPTVLLETGGTNIEQWAGSGIVTQLSGRTRVCTYDRAGTGASDPAPNQRRDADDAVSDAHAVLQAAHVTGPLVLVGRSFGGMIVTHYADVMPQDIVGVVVLDTPAPSAEFTEESEPGLVWDNPDNTQHLDVVHGFENRFAKAPPSIEAPLLLITPVPGEGTAEDEKLLAAGEPTGQAGHAVLRPGANRRPVRHHGRRLRRQPRHERVAAQARTLADQPPSHWPNQAADRRTVIGRSETCRSKRHPQSATHCESRKCVRKG